MNGTSLLFVIVLILAPFLLMYNGLIAKKNQVANAFGGLDAMLQKRYDLVPNLVAAVQGYMQHERDLLVRIVQLRNTASSAPRAKERQGADDHLTAAISQLFLLSEQYPNLRAVEDFLQLQASLNEIEEQISAARRAFNASVTDYNNAVEMFPSSLVAGMMGLQKKDWFEIADAQRQNVDLSGKLTA
jgi:LemA protein